MAKVEIVRQHHLSFSEARALAKSWVQEGEEKYDLTGNYVEGEVKDSLDFSRKGLSGVLTVTESQFELELTLGFLFSAYKNKIVEKIHTNMDKLLG